MDAPDRAAQRPDATLVALGVFAVVAALAYGFRLGSPVPQAVVCWSLLAVLQGGFAVTAWQVARRTPSRAVRRLWSTCVVGGAAYLAGDLMQLADLARGPFSAGVALGTDARMLTVIVGTAAMLVGMLSSPLGIAVAAARARYRLDVVIVMVSATTIGLCSVDLPGAQRPEDLWSELTVAVVTGPAVLLVAVLAMIKLLLGGNPPFTRAAGLVCGVAAGCQAALLAVPHGWADAHVPWALGVNLVGSTLLAAGARIQLLQVGHDPAVQAGGRQRRYTVVPYLAIVAMDALLVGELAGNGLDAHAWVLLTGTIVGSVLVWLRQLAAFRQIADLSARLRDLAFRDGLTGLANRALFMERLAAAAAPTVFLIDLDDFKPVNDRHGHATGDRLLEEVARRLRGCVRGTDTVARLGGDEFAVLVDGAEPGRRADVSAALMEALHGDVRIGEALVPLRASIGVASAADRSDPDGLLHQADMAMYAMKQRSKTLVS